jgi:hypothetical protein
LQAIAELVDETGKLLKAFLMGAANGLLSLLDMIIRVIAWCVDKTAIITDVNKTFDSQNYLKARKAMEVIEDLYDFLDENTSAFLESIEQLRKTFDIDELNTFADSLAKKVKDEVSNLNRYDAAYYCGNIVFEIIASVGLAICTGGGSLIAQASTKAGKAAQLLKIIAKETVSTLTLGVFDILKVMKSFFLKLIEKGKQGFKAFLEYIRKMLSGELEDIKTPLNESDLDSVDNLNTNNGVDNIDENSPSNNSDNVPIKLTAKQMWDNLTYEELSRIPPPTKPKPCFLAGTLVHTQNGLVAIENLKIGDKVLSYNLKTKQTEFKSIINTHNNFTEKYVSIYTSNADAIQATGAHLFYVYDTHIWMPARELKQGMNLMDTHGQAVIILEIKTIDATQSTFNLEVADNNNYFVGTNGILTHNAARIFKYADRTEYEFIHYVLRENGKDLYVGITAQEFSKRFDQHVNEGRRALQGIKPHNAWKAGRITADYINLPVHLNSVPEKPIKMTFFESRVIEMHEIAERGGIKNLKNISKPMSKASFIVWKKIGWFNPCRFYV